MLPNKTDSAATLLHETDYDAILPCETDSAAILSYEIDSAATLPYETDFLPYGTNRTSTRLRKNTQHPDKKQTTRKRFNETRFSFKGLVKIRDTDVEHIRTIWLAVYHTDT